MNPVRIMLVDDHPLIREAVGHLIAESSEFELVGEASNGKECFERIESLRPDILILDIAMPEMNGEQVARELRRLYPRHTRHTHGPSIQAIRASRGCKGSFWFRRVQSQAQANSCSISRITW